MAAARGFRQTPALRANLEARVAGSLKALDRIERDWNRDTDLDGKINAIDKDSDNDGVPDGTEDADHDGVRDASETDPLGATHPLIAGR